MYMFELLVPPEPAQLEKLGGDKKAFDRELRPKLMVAGHPRASGRRRRGRRLEDRGAGSVEECKKVVAAAHRGGREKVGCIILGRGEDDKKVREWLSTAAKVPGFIGFAVGRTTFWDPLVDFRAGKLSRAEAVAEIARRYREWVDIFEKGKSA